MSSSSAYSFQNLIRIIAVLAGWIGAALLTPLATSSGSRYRRVVGVSPYQPPPFVFMIVWTILYIGFIMAWLYIVSVVTSYKIYGTSPADLTRFDRLFLAAIFVNFLWAVVVAAGSVEALYGLSPVTTHYISIGVLILLIGILFYIWYEFSRIIGKRAKYYSAVSVYLWAYIGWLCVATFLSLTVKDGNRKPSYIFR